MINVSRACPVGPSTTRAVSFRITADVDTPSLLWRRASESADVLVPSSGAIDPGGTTDVALEQTVLGQKLVVEVTDGSHVLLKLNLTNY